MEYKKLTLTVESKIYNPSEQLEEYCRFYTHLKRKMFNIIRHNSDTLNRNQLQNEFSVEHNVLVKITKSLFIKCTGEILSIKELDKLEVEELEYKIKTLETKKRTTNKNKKHKNRLKINKLQTKINNILVN